MPAISATSTATSSTSSAWASRFALRRGNRVLGAPRSVTVTERPSGASTCRRGSAPAGCRTAREPPGLKCRPSAFPSFPAQDPRFLPIGCTRLLDDALLLRVHWKGLRPVSSRAKMTSCTRLFDWFTACRVTRPALTVGLSTTILICAIEGSVDASCSLISSVWGDGGRPGNPGRECRTASTARQRWYFVTR